MLQDHQDLPGPIPFFEVIAGVEEELLGRQLDRYLTLVFGDQCHVGLLRLAGNTARCLLHCARSMFRFVLGRPDACKAPG